MKYLRPILFAVTLLVSAGSSAIAQQTQLSFTNNIEFGKEQQLMFGAANKAIKGDLRGAEMDYSQVISMNASNVDAYLQRGLIRRELKNPAGAKADGQAAAVLANKRVEQYPNKSSAYHQRGMAYRLLGNYVQAAKDVQRAYQMTHDESIRVDLQAIVLEQKTAKP